MRGFERGFSFLLGFLFLLPLISGATIVEVPQAPQQTTSSVWKLPVDILTSQIFWGGVVILIILVILAVVCFFVIRWLIGYIKSRSDIFFRLRKDRLKLCKIHRRYPSSHWWKVEKNTPIRLVKREGSNLIITKPIGYHRGDYTTHEGNTIISLNLQGNNKWFFFPITDMLIIPNKDSINIAQRDNSGKGTITKIDNLPKSSDVVRFNENEILLYAESLSSVGMFLIPVLKSKDGKIMDLSLPVYETLKQVVLGEYLYEQTDEFGKLAKQSMNINPNLRYAMKSQDASQSVELPPSSK